MRKLFALGGINIQRVQIMAAAMWTKAAQWTAHLPSRTAKHLKYFSLLKHRSMRLRSLWYAGSGGSGLGVSGSRGDDGLGSDLLPLSSETVGVANATNQHGGGRLASKESWDGEEIVALSGRDDEPGGPALTVAGHVDLVRQPVSGTPHSRIEAPLFELEARPIIACWCARTKVESSIRYRLPRSLVRSSNTRSQSPAAPQRLNRLCTVFHLT